MSRRSRRGHGTPSPQIPPSLRTAAATRTIRRPRRTSITPVAISLLERNVLCALLCAGRGHILYLCGFQREYFPQRRERGDGYGRHVHLCRPQRYEQERDARPRADGSRSSVPQRELPLLFDDGHERQRAVPYQTIRGTRTTTTTSKARRRRTTTIRRRSTCSSTTTAPGTSRRSSPSAERSICSSTARATTRAAMRMSCKTPPTTKR